MAHGTVVHEMGDDAAINHEGANYGRIEAMSSAEWWEIPVTTSKGILSCKGNFHVG